MILEDEVIERLMARKKAIQDTLAAQANAPAQSGCSSGGCSSASQSAPSRSKALPRSPQGKDKSAVLLLSLLRVAGLAAAAGVGLWALVQAL